MVEHRTIEDPRFDSRLDHIVRGQGRLGESVTEGNEYALDLEMAGMLVEHFAPMRQPAPGVGDRIWRHTQERIDADTRSRFHPSSGILSLLTVDRRRLIALATAVLLMLSAMTPVGSQVVAMAEEVMEARGWIERAETPGDEGATIVLDGTELPAGAPTVVVDAITVPYDPNIPGQVEPYDPQADE